MANWTRLRLDRPNSQIVLEEVDTDTGSLVANYPLIDINLATLVSLTSISSGAVMEPRLVALCDPSTGAQLAAVALLTLPA